LSICVQTCGRLVKYVNYVNSVLKYCIISRMGWYYYFSYKTLFGIRPIPNLLKKQSSDQNMGLIYQIMR
jgi:hypothetical protein